MPSITTGAPSRAWEMQEGRPTQAQAWARRIIPFLPISKTRHVFIPFAFIPTCVCVCAQRSVLSDSATPWAVARQAPLSVSFPGENTRVDCIVVKHGFNMLLQRKGPQRPGCPGPGKPHAAPAEGQMGTTGAHPGRTAPQTVGGPG